MQAAKQIRFRTNWRRSEAVRNSSRSLMRPHPTETELGLGLDRRDVLDCRERLGPLLGIAHVGVQERQVKLDVLGFLEQLARQEQPGFGRIYVLVQVEDQVVGDD